MQNVRTWERSYDDLGVNGLKHRPANKGWTPEQRFDLVSKVLAGNSIAGVARSAHMDSGQLCNWVRKYREKGLDGLKCLRKGRPPKRGPSIDTMPRKKAKLTQTEREELKLLRERNEYLEAENLYLKKLRALELEKTAKLAKAKKRKSSKPSKGR